jgi:propionyl-CoA carboxylase alpha chain
VSEIRRLLVANRAEIASRVLRTARARGTETVAVYSDVDAGLPYVAAADTAVHLSGTSPADTYLRIDRLVAAALATGADAVHPGYGFLSENAAFAVACEDAKLTFVGPPAAVIAQMGSKLEAKRVMGDAGVPVLPGGVVDPGDPGAAVALAATIGYPLLVKASAGGGGRGMRVVVGADALDAAVESASREAASAFGDGTVFLERLVTAPRHVEVQVFGDAHGTVVDLFERECSIQRRHQKLVEETPSPGIGEATRTAIRAAAVTAARAIGYVNAGTVEFVVDRDGAFYFLEVNTRLQVEHPVTELVTGLDLVELQLQVAEGRPLDPTVAGASTRGHAIEVRLYAEDPEAGYLPDAGRLSAFELDADEGVRVDAGYATGSSVPSAYDAMLAKVAAWGPTREAAATRLAAALRRARLHGVTTNRDLLVGVLQHPEFLDGATDTAFLERHDPATLSASARDPDQRAYCVLAAIWQRVTDRPPSPQPVGLPAAWRNVGPADQPRTYLVRDLAHEVLVTGPHGARRVLLDGEPVALGRVELGAWGAAGEVDGRHVRVALVRDGDRVFADGSLGAATLVEVPRLRPSAAEEDPGSLHAPLPGAVRRVTVSTGATVSQGDVLVVLEAMKMEHAIRAPHDGTVTSVLVADGDQVDGGAVLVVVEPRTGATPGPESSAGEAGA